MNSKRRIVGVSLAVAAVAAGRSLWLIRHVVGAIRRHHRLGGFRDHFVDTASGIRGPHRR